MLTQVEGSVYTTPTTRFYFYYTAGYVISTPNLLVLVDPPSDVLVSLKKTFPEELKKTSITKIVIFSHYHKAVTPPAKNDLINEGFRIISAGTYFDKRINVIPNLNVMYAPGHTKDSIIIEYLENDQVHWFTGDTLMVSNDKLLEIDNVYCNDPKELQETLRQLKSGTPTYIHSSVGQMHRSLAIKDKKEWQELLNKVIR